MMKYELSNNVVVEVESVSDGSFELTVTDKFGMYKCVADDFESVYSEIKFLETREG